MKYNLIEFTTDIINRFWNKVIIQYDENGNVLFNECMIWNAGQFSDGYGAFSIKRKTYRSHRLIYVWYYGHIIDTDLVVCHTCDTPLCVNPLHLFLGTCLINSTDSVNKGRTLKGSKNPYSILNESQVIQIKLYLKSNQYRQIDIAKKFNVSRPTITDINVGNTWSHITV